MRPSPNFPVPSSSTVDADTDATIEAFRWLLIFGFPAAVAAARLMPDQFSDMIDDAAKLARRVTRNPFGR